MSDFDLKICLKQVVIVDGDFKLPLTDDLLLSMINHNAAGNETEMLEMKNPKRMIVQIAISTKEFEPG